MTEDGKCVTLDNDSGRRMDYDEETKRWIYVDPEDGQQGYKLKAASCALGGKTSPKEYISENGVLMFCLWLISGKSCAKMDVILRSNYCAC